jgi:predicted ATP-dependent endonuclease of OLD family
MKLSSVEIKEFKSIKDSGRFDIGDVTCLVGRNESGKTAILEALYRLNPIISEQGKFDVTEDYPRANEEDYQQAIERKERSHAIVVTAYFSLESDEILEVENEFGQNIFKYSQLVLQKGYSNQLTPWLFIDETIVGSNLLKKAALDDIGKRKDTAWKNLKELHAVLEMESANQAQAYTTATATANALTNVDAKNKAISDALLLQETSLSKQLREKLAAITKVGIISYIYELYLRKSIPRFLYFDEYYQMEGQLNIEQLKQRQANNALLDSDRPMLGLIELARLDVDQLLATDRTEALLNKLEGTSVYLTKKILKYWSQNRHLSVKFDIRPARPNDPPGMRQGVNLWGLVTDSVHMATTRLGRRSKGFVWFFSFLAWFSQQKKTSGNIILLLDEPGMALHGTAQGDLLRYIEEELKPHHQVIFTTHSPFMVDPRHFERVRIVEDKSSSVEDPNIEEIPGTMVYTDVLEVGEGSLFPLQGALGYDLSQSLFVGPNSLIVEGVSDLLFIQVVSALLESANREGLDKAWTITPVGGAEKVPTFAALLGSQKGLKIATLIDVQKKDKQNVENLYKRKLLEQKHVITFADFTGKDEADIEDMFDVGFYLKLVNGEFASVLTAPIVATDLNEKSPRVLVSIEAFLKTNPLKNGVNFNHYRPARYFVEHSGKPGFSLPKSTLDRFEQAFKKLNKIL